jgi:hypothetical protein
MRRTCWRAPSAVREIRLWLAKLLKLAVPLTPRAVEIIELMKQAKTCDLVFPGNKKEPMFDATLLAVIKRMNGEKKKPRPEPVWVDPKEGNAPIVAHGFALTARQIPLIAAPADRPRGFFFSLGEDDGKGAALAAEGGRRAVACVRWYARQLAR